MRITECIEIDNKAESLDINESAAKAMDEVYCPVYKSRDYDRFTFVLGNRPLMERQVRKLMKSMESFGFLSCKPLITSSGYMYDGQHRLEAARRLGIDYYYLDSLSLDPEMIIVLNKDTEVWKSRDYCYFHAVRNHNPHYEMLINMQEEYGLPLIVVASALSGIYIHNSKRAAIDLKDGLFTVRDSNVARRHLSSIRDFSLFCDFWNNSRFGIAAHRIVRHPDYQHERMISKLDYQQQRIHRCVTITEYVLMLERIYNFNAKKSEIVRFTLD